MSSRREPEPDPPRGFSIMEDNPLRAPSRALQPLPPPGNQQPHRVTNFYIENILRPDFGLKKKKDDEDDEEEEEDVPDRFGPVRVGLMKGRGQLTRGKSPRTGEEDSNQDSRPRSPEADAGPAAAAPPWPAWVYCTRYSDRPSSGPRSRKPRRTQTQVPNRDDKRPRTAFTSEQLQRLKTEFQRNRYLTEHRRRNLARDLDLSEPQVKIWFQNNRAKTKKASGNRNSLALQLMAEGLYNHSSARDGD